MSILSLKSLFLSTLIINIGLIHPGLTDDQFIFGGGYPDLGIFPHHAHLQIYHDSHLYVCAGSLIRYNWVLTAAQCVLRFDNIQVYLGLVNREEGPIQHIVAVDKADHVIIHEDYNPPSVLSNDIAMIYLENAKPEWLDHPYVGTVDLPQNINDNFVGQTATATGFGVTSDDVGAEISMDLKYVDMPVITNEVCAQTFGNVITESKLCTGTATGSTCAGDEGSGLTVEIEGIRTIIGIGSFRAAIGCTLGHPAVFTRVTEFVDWINYNVQNPPNGPPTDDTCVCDCVCHTCPASGVKEEL
ncbi:brachyurin-like [Chironomus tepperi]|uniref:brachyurin-like n=1 Tax=Chironomus tepperi TaxID=113505 RepID=UPI00391F1AD7